MQQHGYTSPPLGRSNRIRPFSSLSSAGDNSIHPIFVAKKCRAQERDSPSRRPESRNVLTSSTRRRRRCRRRRRRRHRNSRERVASLYGFTFERRRDAAQVFPADASCLIVLRLVNDVRISMKIVTHRRINRVPFSLSLSLLLAVGRCSLKLVRSALSPRYSLASLAWHENMHELFEIR